MKLGMVQDVRVKSITRVNWNTLEGSIFRDTSAPLEARLDYSVRSTYKRRAAKQARQFGRREIARTITDAYRYDLDEVARRQRLAYEDAQCELERLDYEAMIAEQEAFDRDVAYEDALELELMRQEAREEAWEQFQEQFQEQYCGMEPA